MTKRRGWGSSPPSDDEYATWDAAYVLGCLSNADRREFEGHLSTCSSCRRAVSEIADIPRLLTQLTSGEIESIDESDGPDAGVLRHEVSGSLLNAVRRRRDRARLLAWAGSGAAAAAVAIGLALALRPGPAASPPAPQADVKSTQSMTPVQPSPLTATVELVHYSWGTKIEVHCTYAAQPAEAGQDDDGDRLAMVAVARDGAHTQLATWIGRPGIIATPAADLALPIDQIASVQVISADTGDVLSQYSP